MAPGKSKRLKKVLSCLQEQPKIPKILFLMWLVFVLDRKLFQGLRWGDRDEGIFYVSSTHQRASIWDPNRAAHCEEWSKFKNHNCKKKKKRVYKAGFRTTLNSKGKQKKEQIRKIGKIKGEDGDWIQYCLIDKSFLSNKPDPFLQSYYDSPRQREFSSSNEGEPFTTTSLPPFSAEFKNYERTDPERQNLRQQEPTSTQKDVQSSVAKRTKPVRNRKSVVKKPKNLDQTPRRRKNFNQNSPENCLLAEDDAVKSPLQYLNQMTPESQITDVTFKEDDCQNFHCFKNQEIPINTEYQPFTPMSCIGDTQEAVSPSSSHVPSNSLNSLNCICDFNQNSFCHCTPNTGDQNEYAAFNHQPQPPYSVGDTQEAFSPSSSHFSPNSLNSLNCICNFNQNSFCHCTPSTGDQNEYVAFNHQSQPPYPVDHYEYVTFNHQSQPHYPVGQYDTCLTNQFCNNPKELHINSSSHFWYPSHSTIQDPISRKCPTPEPSFEHLPDCVYEMFMEAGKLLEEQNIFSLLETHNNY